MDKHTLELYNLKLDPSEKRNIAMVAVIHFFTQIIDCHCQNYAQYIL